jgi:hypothetical protein
MFVNKEWFDMRVLSLFLILLFSSLSFADTARPLISTSFEDGFAGLAGLGADTLEWGIVLYNGDGASCYIDSTVSYLGSKSLAVTGDSGAAGIRCWAEIFFPMSKWLHVRYMARYDRPFVGLGEHPSGLIHYWNDVKDNPIGDGKKMCRIGLQSSSVTLMSCGLEDTLRVLPSDSLALYFVTRDDTCGLNSQLPTRCYGIIKRDEWHRYDIIMKNESSGYIKRYVDGKLVYSESAVLDTSAANYLHLGIWNSFGTQIGEGSYYYDCLLVDTSYSIPCRAAELGLDSLPMRR